MFLLKAGTDSGLKSRSEVLFLRKFWRKLIFCEKWSQLIIIIDLSRL